jgi:hypothetical protein
MHSIKSNLFLSFDHTACLCPGQNKKLKQIKNEEKIMLHIIVGPSQQCNSYSASYHFPLASIRWAPSNATTEWMKNIYKLARNVHVVLLTTTDKIICFPCKFVKGVGGDSILYRAL